MYRFSISKKDIEKIFLKYKELFLKKEWLMVLKKYRISVLKLLSSFDHIEKIRAKIRAKDIDRHRRTLSMIDNIKSYMTGIQNFYNAINRQKKLVIVLDDSVAGIHSIGSYGIDRHSCLRDNYCVLDSICRNKGFLCKVYEVYSNNIANIITRSIGKKKNNKYIISNFYPNRDQRQIIVNKIITICGLLKLEKKPMTLGPYKRFASFFYNRDGFSLTWK